MLNLKKKKNLFYINDQITYIVEVGLETETDRLLAIRQRGLSSQYSLFHLSTVN